MQLSEYAELDATDLASAIRKGDVSAEEVAALANAAIAKLNPTLNAVVHEADPEAYAGSDLDAAFGGVPFLLKDLGHGWAGIPSTMGSRIAEGLCFESDGPIAARFKQGGLRAIGVSASSEFGMNAVVETFRHGPTCNPWDVSLSPGGSSGGAAVAVAAGIVPIAHATDGGGSIRQPAAWCGVVGLKPSRGRNPVGSNQSSDGNAWVVAHHVVSRSVRDTAVALDITSGPLPGDYVNVERPSRSFGAVTEKAPRPLRIALCTQFVEAPHTDPTCVRAARDAAQLLEELGHSIEEVTPDIGLPDMVQTCFELFLHGAAEGILSVSRMTGVAPTSASLEPPSLAVIELARTRSAASLRMALQSMIVMSRTMGSFHEQYDVLLTPAVSSLPCKLGVHHASRYEQNGGEFWDFESGLYAFSPLGSITGQPALVLPFPMPETVLPVGIQLMGRNGDDATMLQLGAQIEQARGWSHLKPAIHAGHA